MDLDGSGVATMYLLNPTGGVLGGDVLTTDVALGSGAHVCLTTPSATRVYRATGAPSVLRTRVRLEAGAVLEWVPDHVIPSPGARLVQALEVDLGPGALALLVDSWTPGRVVRGEAWGFRLLDLTTSAVDRAGPIFRERARLEGPMHGEGPGLTENRPYVATFAAVGACAQDWPGLALVLHDALASRGDRVLGGAAPLGRGGVVAKLLARSAPDLHAAIAQVWRLSRAMLLGLPPLDLRKL